MIQGSRINVLDFGAVGDGVTDDTAAIQAAIECGFV
jgi:polygalacturonase